MYAAKRLRMRPIFVVLIVASFLLAACGARVAGNNWPGLSADGEEVYVAYGQGVAKVDTASWTVQWTFPEEASGSLQFYAPPAIGQGKVILGDFGSTGGMFSPQLIVTVYALDPESGSEIWANSDFAKDRVIAPPLLTDAQVFVGTADNHVYALSAEDGSLQWDFKTGHSIWAQPVYNEETVYVVSMDNSVSALNASTGEVIWQQMLTGSVASAPALVDGILYVPSFDHQLHAFDADTGTEIWAREAENWVWASPVVADGAVFFADVDGNIYAYSADREGTSLWQQQAEGHVQSTPLYDDGTLYVVSGDTEGPDEERRGHILALDASSGEMTWDQPGETPVPVFTRPVMASGQLLVLLPDGTLQAYDPDSGVLVRELAVAPES